MFEVEQSQEPVLSVFIMSSSQVSSAVCWVVKAVWGLEAYSNIKDKKKKILNDEIYREKVFNIIEKHKMQQKLGTVWNQLLLYEIKLIF